MPTRALWIAAAVLMVLGVCAHAENSPGYFWTRLSPDTVPPPRWSAGDLVYDSRRDVLTMFGGIADDAPFQNDTWEWNGSNWTERTTGVAPDARRNHAMAYDSIRGRTYVISGLGFNDQPPFNLFRYDDLWAWDGDTWTEILATPRPAPRQGSSAVFDQLRGEVVLFSGRCSGGTDCDDTWTFDGTSWTRRFPSTVPAPREAHTLVYDSRRGVVVMFGGSSGPFTFLNDTWEWDGTDWRQVLTSSAPAVRSGAAGAFDPVTGLTIIHGGASPGLVHADTWTFDGASWTEVTLAPPSRRQQAIMSYRPGDGVIMFGGLDNTGSTARINYAETWRLGSGDLTPPAVICPEQPVFLLHAKNPEISARVVDEPGGSGALVETVSVDASSAAAGIQTVEITGSDRAGHTSTAACQYRVGYQFKGFDAPVLGGGVLNEAVAGSEIVFRWGLFDANDAPVRNLSTVKIAVSSVPCALGETPDLPPLHGHLRNFGNGFYKITWATPRAYARSCKAAHLDFGEGITRDAMFQFVK